MHLKSRYDLCQARVLKTRRKQDMCLTSVDSLMSSPQHNPTRSRHPLGPDDHDIQPRRLI